jgi:TonB family protein
MNSVYSPGTTFQAIPRQWSTMSGSALLHAAVIGGVVLLAGAAAGIVAPPVETDLTFVHVVPKVPLELPKSLPPVVKREVRFVETPPTPEPPKPEPVEEKVIARAEPAPTPEPPAEKAIEPPKVKPKELTVGSFDPTGNSTRAPEAAREVVKAGFDAAAARTPDLKMATAAVGGFEQARGPARTGTDRPNVVGDAGFGAGVSTGKGRGGAGGVVTSGGFGAATSGGGGGRPVGAVKTSAFDERAEQKTVQAVRQAPRETPIEILSKPTPVYTDEARAMKIEGEVLLEVEFGADGNITVMRIVRGLGHGLDEAAMRAVRSMRFKPAQRDGEAVDIRTTVNIVFRLA